MSDRKDRKTLNLSTFGPARRRFLKQAALSAAGATAAAGGKAAAGEASSGDCRAVNAPMKEVKGKVAFITGGASGIGLGMAKVFTQAGMKVVIGDVNADYMSQAKAEFDQAGTRSAVHFIRVDVTDRPGLERAADESAKVFGNVHVLVNNAGVLSRASLSTTTYEDWDWVMRINVDGVFNGIRTFLPRIQAHGEGGQIVTTASIAGLFVHAGLGSYCVSKFAAVAIMEELREELVGTNIGVSVCCPGGVSTNIVNSRRRPGEPPVQGLPKSDPRLLDPLEVGRLTLLGIRKNDLYILTHPEFEHAIRQRSEALLASNPNDAKPNQARMQIGQTMAQKSVYAVEIAHKRCG